MTGNRIDQTDDCDPIEESIAQLHRTGWSVGDVAFHDGSGRLTWIFSGSNGENLIRAMGRTLVVTQFQAQRRQIPFVLRWPA